MTKARDLSKLLSTSNGKIAGSNLDVSFENISDTGTEGTKLATGTTAQRGSTQGQFRFNTDTGKFEGRTASGFASIEPFPVVSSVDVTEVASDAGGNATFVITGDNFSSGDVVKFIGSDGTEITATTTTVNSATQLTAVIPNASFVNAKEPYDVKVTKATNFSAQLDNQINVDNSPVWQTASGSLGTINNTARTGINISTSATDAEGDTVSYSVQSGSLPAGLSLNSSTGAITGDADDVSSNTTSSFTLRATAGGKTADRAFTITVNALVSAKTVFDFTSAVMQTFTIPSGITSVDFVMWGAGSGYAGASDGMEGTGGFGSGTIDTTGLSNLYIVVGQSGFGAGGRQAGGGLSGIFSANSVTQGNAIAICGGGGGSSETSGAGAGGGGGGGLNQSGLNGTAGRQGSGAGGASTSGGGSGASSTGGNAGQSGSALQGGGAPGYHTSWTTRAYYGGGIPHRANNGHPGGCGGAGYYGGGGGSDYYGTGGGGGSGYADTSIVSNIVAIQGNTDSNNNPTNSSHAEWSGEISRGTSAGHGRVVIQYQL